MFSKYFTIYLTFTTAIICDDKTVKAQLLNQEEQHFHAELTIYNGNPATVGQIPYFVSIKEPIRRYSEDKILWKNLCGGSIIGINKVLTAAHCFEVYEYEYLRNPQKLRVVAGSIRNAIIYSGLNKTEVDNQWRAIDRIILHEDFKFPNSDIALVIVSNWVYSDYISYVVPATVVIDYDNPCMAAGFGMISLRMKETASPVLLVTKISVMPRWRCTILWDRNMDAFLCSDPSETEVTRGNSGGPLVCSSTIDPAEESGRDLLVGIVSGKSSARSTLYTRVSAHGDWMERSFATRSLVNSHLCLTMSILLLYAVHGI